jgi:hypothetical protein
MTLRTIVVLDAYLREVEKGLAGDSTAEIGKRFEELKRSRAEMTFADPTLLEMARQKYAYGSSDDVEIDDEAITAKSDTGMWVNAWVHIRLPKGGD